MPFDKGMGPSLSHFVGEGLLLRLGANWPLSHEMGEGGTRRDCDGRVRVVPHDPLG